MLVWIEQVFPQSESVLRNNLRAAPGFLLHFKHQTTHKKQMRWIRMDNQYIYFTDDQNAPYSDLVVVEDKYLFSPG